MSYVNQSNVKPNDLGETGINLVDLFEGIENKMASKPNIGNIFNEFFISIRPRRPR